MWLYKLKGKVQKIERHKKRDKAKKNNSIFQKDEGNFQKKTNERSNSRDKYQQWINSLNPGQSHRKMTLKHPTKIE